MAAEAEGVKREDPAVSSLQEEANEWFTQQKIALLGEEGYSALEEYERTVLVRGMAHGLAAAVAFSDPLTAEQAERLTRAVAEESRSYQEGGFADIAEVDWDAVDRRARLILSPAQFEVWQRGDAHDPLVGSRSSLRLERLYEQAINEEGNTTVGR